jgi:ATP-dependent DNA helicase PIF1
MVCGKNFELIEKIAKIVRKSDKPFGGIQLVVCGDFLQLPPVTKRCENRYFSFQSQSWSQTIQLSFAIFSMSSKFLPQTIDISSIIRHLHFFHLFS